MKNISFTYSAKGPSADLVGTLVRENERHAFVVMPSREDGKLITRIFKREWMRNVKQA